ncbi:MAG: penicillin-binding protein 1C [Bacteroidales bacterium]|nr:penicillin-binding protein 1C [Bacteroidales bacterium]
MKRFRTRYIVLGVCSTFFLLWLCCLPSHLFEGVPYSTVVTDCHGDLLGARVADDGQWRFPPGDSLPEKFVRAVVEYEDRSFYSHCGVSARGIGRAIVQNVSHGRVVSGGSTITMQTIRLHRRGKRNIWEKFVEMCMATRLELSLSKAEILRLYTAHAPFGGNVVGIEAAVWRYLGNDGNDMSWAEAATLAVLQNAPSAIHLSKNRDKLLAKRNRLLTRLHDKGELSAEEYALAVEEPLIGQPYPMPQFAPHWVEQFHRRNHGMLTRSTVDLPLQLRLEDVTSRWRGDLARAGVNDLAAIVAEVSTGNIVAYCGNADIKASRPGCWVDVTQAPRSSGSILKPLLYCAAIQEGLILENSILPDIPTDFGGFMPKNFDGSYSGVIGAKSALALSLNIPNVWLLKEFGVARFASILQRCGLKTLNREADRYGLSLILGGAEVTLKDVVNCYARLARYDSCMVLNDSVAIYAMLDAMREVDRPDRLDWSRASSVQNVAWKTGTSYGGRDGWAIGVTPGYVVGVWVGNADGRGVADLTGARSAGPVMFDIFNLLPASGWFKEPQGRLEKVCRQSGHLAGKYCKDTVLQKVAGNAHKSARCSYCTEIPISTDGLRRVVNASEPSVMQSYFILPPVHKYYYKQVNADYVEPPADMSGNQINMKFIYPSDGAVVSIPRQMDGSPGSLTCKVACSTPGEQLFWHLDNHFVGTTTDLHQVQIAPEAGVHKLTVYDSRSSISLDLIVR